MSKTVMIVEKDLALVKSMRDGLQSRGFTVEETTDGKGAPELIRKHRPDLVVLAVDLDAGQNGYIICKKLKSDGDLKGVPIIIVGDPKGFDSHQKLKTRAEDYLGKPFDPSTLVDRVGAAIGFPEGPPLGEDVFDPGALMLVEDALPEEIGLESALAEEPPAEPDFDLVDNMFGEQRAPTTQPSAPPIAELAADDLAFANLETGEEGLNEKTVVGLVAPPARRVTDKPAYFQSSGSISIDPAEARELRSRVTELTGTLEDARAQAAEFEAKVRELEQQLETRQSELDAARAPVSKGDSKEVFALKDAANKKDKEILRFKNELNAKEQEIVELREKENTLEQAASEASGELAKRDAQIKTLQTRADQLTAERKKTDHQLLQAREESRASAAKLTTLESDFEAQQARLIEVEAQLEPMREAQAEAEAARSTLEGDLAQARRELEAVGTQLEERTREVEDVRAINEQTQLDLDTTRAQLTSQATSFADEISGLRQRITQAEAVARGHETRAARHQARVRAQQEQLERLRVALQAAMATLDESGGDNEDLELDELAEA